MEWQRAQAHNAYPFVEDSGTVASDGRPLSDAFADLSLLVSAENIRLTFMSDPTVEPVSVVFEGDEGIVYSAADGVVSTFGAWTTVRWGKASVLVDTARVALHTWPAAVEMYVVPDALGASTRNVTKLSVAISDSLSFDVGAADVLEIEEGYNLGVAAADTTDIRKTSQIVISAGAGLGKGQFSSCNDASILTRVNSVPANYGKLNIQGLDCMHVLRRRGNEISASVWEFEDGVLDVVDKCTPCCDCNDYVDVYSNLLTPIYADAKTASDRLYDALADYENLRLRIEEERLCREGLSISAYLSARPGWYMQLQVVIRNNTDCATGPFDLSIVQTDGATLTLPATARVYRSGTITNPATALSTNAAAVTIGEPLRAAEQVHVNFTLYADEASGRAEGGVVSVLANLFDGDVGLDAAASAEFVGPFNR